MGDTSTSATMISKLDIGDPLYLHPSDSSTLTIVSIKLKGTENYPVWSNAMRLALEAKNKYGFIDGKCIKPKDDQVLANQWERCNSVVITWLLNSISEELFLGQVFSKLASEVWTDLKESFDKVDGSVVYDLYKRINGISQNGSTVAEYYNRLTTMWKQFDAMVQLPTCSCQAAKDYNDFSTLIKLMQFLMGLDDIYQPVRTNLLTREPFPSVKVAFSIVSREESHRLASNGSKGQNVSFVTKSNQSFDSRKKNTRGPNPNLKCSHCNMLGHTVDRCYEVIGYPPGFRKRSGGQSYRSNVSNNNNKSNSTVGSSNSVGTAMPFTSEQISKLLSLVGESSGGEQAKSNMGGESSVTCSFATGFVSCSSSAMFEFEYNWIVDSGANQHMVKSDKGMFDWVDVSDYNLKVSHPNGTNVKVCKIGKIKLVNNVILEDVFYVPGYSVNLLSVFKLAKDNKIGVLFDENHCLLQDLRSKKVLVTGSQDNGLYFVGKHGNSVNVCLNSVFKSTRLVAKGFNQREGLDFGETFSPVVKMVTVRCIIALAVQNDWPMFQLDINNAFLYGTINEDVYMCLPKGYYSPDETRVCKLVKSLYGLKQAPRKWNEKLSSVLVDYGFVQSKCDHSMYVLSRNGVFIVLLVYVDDIVVTGNNIDEVNKIKGVLNLNFQIKDLGKLKYFLGIEVLYNKSGVCLNQRKYCLELLSEFGYLACKPIKTPIEQSYLITAKISKNQSVLKNITGFQKLVGKLIYLSLTRPDISYAVQFLSQFMHSPTDMHLQIALRLLRYLKSGPGCGLLFKKDDKLGLVGFVDSDWAKCLSTRKSVTGYCVYLGGSLVSWKSKKQSTVSRSTGEAEYRAMCSATCEIMWLLNLLREVGVNCELPVKLYCDSKAAISIAANPVFHEKTKHFEVDLHFLREKVGSGIIETVKVDSESQPADGFTKGLSVEQHKIDIVGGPYCNFH
ncbi:putative RNA-directed DNA polymerase [Helianthus annuus]|nr:putative RNA-directed DNA polymerase [Helianthus annuus]